MKIHLAAYEPDRRGGGWSFQRNFAKGSQVYSYDEADVFLISGASMLTRGEVDKAKADGKKIVLRADNMPRQSRNRRWMGEDGKTRVKYFAEIADLVIYQSQWAKDFLMPHLKTDGPVILNGVDLQKYNSDFRAADDDSHLYIRSSRDEGKQWILAWYWFVNNPGTLQIVGPFSPENFEHNFDFYNDERYYFLGELPELSNIYKNNRYFLYTYSNDACSNTLLEARASGCEIIDVFGMLKTGGAPEIMALEDLSLERMVKQYKEALETLC